MSTPHDAAAQERIGATVSDFGSVVRNVCLRLVKQCADALVDPSRMWGVVIFLMCVLIPLLVLGLPSTTDADSQPQGQQPRQKPGTETTSAAGFTARSRKVFSGAPASGRLRRFLFWTGQAISMFLLVVWAVCLLVFLCLLAVYEPKELQREIATHADAAVKQTSDYSSYAQSYLKFRVFRPFVAFAYPYLMDPSFMLWSTLGLGVCVMVGMMMFVIPDHPDEPPPAKAPTKHA